MAPPIVHDVLHSPGRPLDAATRAFMEPRFGHAIGQARPYSPSREAVQTELTVGHPDDPHEREADRVADIVMGKPESRPTSEFGLGGAFDFSRVRVHTGTQAGASARAVNALAYTVGQNIVFDAGQYAPGTTVGRRLLAHELTHVIQQTRSSIEDPAQHHVPAIIQRQVRERDFPPGGRVESVRPGEHLIWNFGIGQHTLKPEHLAQIPSLVEEIKAAFKMDPEQEVDLEGQASSSGTDIQNEPLAEKRAAAVKDALVVAGVDATRIHMTSVGSAKARPAVTPENMARSRAVRVILVSRLPLPQPTPPTPQPQSECQVRTMVPLDLEGGRVHLIRDSQRVALVAGDGKGTAVGMEVIGTAFVTPARCGSFEFVQNVQPFREIVYKDGSRNRMETSTWHLDTSDPFPSQPQIMAQAANDSPSQGIDAFSEGVIRTVEVRDEFRMFFLLRPKVGARRPLQVGAWTWVAQARNKDPQFFAGNLELDTSISRVVPQAGSGRLTSDFPALSPNVSGLQFRVDRGGAPGTNTFADIHVKVLNHGRP